MRNFQIGSSERHFDDEINHFHSVDFLWNLIDTGNTKMDLNLSDDDSQSDQNAEPNTTPSSQNDMRMLKYSWDDIITSDEVSQFCL